VLDGRRGCLCPSRCDTCGASDLSRISSDSEVTVNIKKIY
jgi:hypothetical protein